MISVSALKKATLGKKVLIDSNIIIYLTDMVQPFEPLSRLLFEIIERGDAFAILSIISVMEVMQGPLRKGYSQNAFEVKDYLLNFPNTLCQEITLDVLDKVGRDNRIDWSGLRIADSLIIASGLLNEVDLFISNDKHFKKALSQSLFLSIEK